MLKSTTDRYGAIAVTISNPNLASGQATAAYVVVPAGR